MDRDTLLVHAAALLAIVAFITSWIDAAEPNRRAPVVIRAVNKPQNWPKDDKYLAGVTGNRQLKIDARRGVLANDRPPGPLNRELNGDRELTAELVKPPKHAAHFALNADGSFVYEPQPGFVGWDAFDYRIQGVGGFPASAIIIVPQIPVAIRVKTDASGLPIHPRELTKRKNSNGAGFVIYPVKGPVNVELQLPYSILAQATAALGQPPTAAPGHAALGGDFTLGFTPNWTPEKITIPANSEGVEIDLTVLPDNLVEGPESISIQVQDPSGEPSKVDFKESFVSLTIQDNDYWKWDKQSTAGSYKPNEFDPRLGDWSAVLGGAWFWDDKAGKLVWDDGDSKFQPSASYQIRDDGIVIDANARWEWYCFQWSVVERIVETPQAKLDVAFDFDPTSGHILIRSGTISRSGGQVRVNYRYSIDNSGTSTKVATVRYEVVAGVGGLLASGPIGIMCSAENSDGGGIALSESSVATFILRSTEDP